MKPMNLFDIESPPAISRELLTGDKVMDLLKDEEFLSQWDLLYQKCSWATVFQSRDFVSTWYMIFKDHYLPIVVRSEDNGKLNGLLTLAIKRHKSQKEKLFIVAAGHGEADCQTWLSTASASDEFIKFALSEIRQQFPHEDILIRHLPPGVPLKWTQEDNTWKNNCIVESFERPLIQLKNFSITKRNRKRVNRLEKIGTYEELTSLEELSSHIDKLTLLYDFRQGAMFNRTPYRKNPVYSALIISLFEKGLLKVTVFRVENEIIAGLIVIIGKNKAHLGGINTHSPLYGNYSPGYIQFLLATQQLALENIEYLDLTPGGDAYKDRIATTYDQVHVLVVSGKKHFLLKRKVRKLVHSYLKKAGIRPLSFQLNVDRQKYLIGKRGLWRQLATSLQNKLTPNKPLTYQLELASGEKPASMEVNRNCFEDLLNYKFEGHGLTEWEFLESSMRNFESEKEVFTFSKNGKLQLLVWFHRPAARVEGANPLPEGSIILQDLFCDPSALADAKVFLFSVVNLLHKEFGKAEIFIVLETAQAGIVESGAYDNLVVKKKIPATFQIKSSRRLYF